MTTESLQGYCFTAVKVRYAGPTNSRGSRWIATIGEGDRKVRVTRPYDYALGSGARNALPVAQEAFSRSRHRAAAEIGEWDAGADPADWIAIPAELDTDSYVFTFVPANLA